MDLTFTPRERRFLRALSATGFFLLNGVFVWALVRRPALILEAMRNPVAAVFIVEAFLLVGVLAYLLRRWKITSVPWGWFVFLSLLGGLAFSLPLALLYPGKKPADRA